MNTFVEANASIRAGETIIVRSTGGDAFFQHFIEDDFPSLEHTFVPDADETYWLMFGNRDVDVELFDDA